MEAMKYADVTQIVPPGVQGLAKVEHFTISKEESKATRFWRDGQVSAGKYARLTVGNTLMMTNTKMEQNTNLGLLLQAKGDVLIAGLGIGMVLPPVLAKPEVTSVLVVEKYQDVIDLVAPHYPDPKLTVVCADILQWKPQPGQKFDTIYFDIWPDICTENLTEIATLHRRAAYWKRHKNSWVSSWQVDRLRYERERERRTGWDLW
jgi:spermidine synthase